MSYVCAYTKVFLLACTLHYDHTVGIFFNQTFPLCELIFFLLTASFLSTAIKKFLVRQPSRPDSVEAGAGGGIDARDLVVVRQKISD